MLILLALLRFAAWEAALFALAVRVARACGWRMRAVEGWLAALAIEVTLEASIAGVFSFTGTNSAGAYWVVAALAVAAARLIPARPEEKTAPPPGAWFRWSAPAMAALLAPLVVLAFRPVEEIDSINYLHYLIEWMANRATPYVFATNYVAFWELSFLPAWIVTRIDGFFPLIALKGVALAGLAAWLAGRELGLRRPLLLWTVFGCLAMRYFWFGYSGVPTLKNDAMHGAGFLLLSLVVMRAARRRLCRRDAALLAFGVAFAMVKYTGIFIVVLAVAAIVWLRPRQIRPAPAAAVTLFALLTCGHYYLRSLLLHGSPFYPFQINLGPLHLPGTADLSGTSILYNLRDPRLWRAFALPFGVMPAGPLFPAILWGSLLLAVWLLLRGALRRRTVNPAAVASAGILCGWLLYSRSVYSASAGAGDLAFVLNGLNSLRYVEGVLALAALLLVASIARRAPRLAFLLVAVDAAGRLYMLYRELHAGAWPWVASALALALLAAARRSPRAAAAVAAACLTLASPFLVERARSRWTVYWNDLKPALAAARGPGLAQFAMPDGSYFAGHIVAAGNPVDPSVRALLPAEAAQARPKTLAVLLTPGMSPDWRERYGPSLEQWGYRPVQQSENGAIFERR